MNQPSLFDICHNRHKGNSQSKAANRIAQKERDREIVLDACRREGGVTCRELAAELGRGMNAISGRFSELKAQGLIRQTGRRDGCGVMEVR